jgi:hypothetical protein
MTTVVAIVAAIAGIVAAFFGGLTFERKRVYRQALDEENAIQANLSTKRKEVKDRVEQILNELPPGERNNAIDEYTSDVLKRWNEFKRQRESRQIDTTKDGSGA